MYSNLLCQTVVLSLVVLATDKAPESNSSACRTGSNPFLDGSKQWCWDVTSTQCQARALEKTVILRLRTTFIQAELLWVMNKLMDIRRGRYGTGFGKSATTKASHKASLMALGKGRLHVEMIVHCIAMYIIDVQACTLQACTSFEGG